MSSENTDFGDLESDDSSSWEDVDEMVGLDDENEVPCHSLFMNSLVLEKTFDFLSTRELVECRRVCKEWNKTALLKKLLGSQFKITISKANFDRLLKTAQNSAQPFCRKFEFRLLELEYDKVSKFIRLFGERLNKLTIKYCTVSSSESVIKILNCPRLEELTIYGALPEIKEANFHTFVFSRLKEVSLYSSLDYGQVNKAFISILLKHAPNITTINVGQSISIWKDFCQVFPFKADSKLCHIGFSGIEDPLQFDYFQEFLKKKPSLLSKLSFQNCIILKEFLEQLMKKSSKYLTHLNVDGTQQEILSTVFREREIDMPNLKELTLPIDGVSISDGNFILQKSPQLKRLKIRGLFTTDFIFDLESQLISICMKATVSRTVFSRDNNQQAIILQEKRREFHKIIRLIPPKPLKLEINLPDSVINSICIREIYMQYKQLQQLVLRNCSAKTILVGLTGIPFRLCRHMAQCKSFSVLNPSQVGMLPSVRTLENLKILDITTSGESVTAEMTLLLVVYGICNLPNLQELTLNNFKMSDVALLVLKQKLNLIRCIINGSDERWGQFQSIFLKHTIKSFLLPPPLECGNPESPSVYIGQNSRILRKIFRHLNPDEMFEARKVCNYWHALISNYLHQGCSSEDYLTADLEQRLIHYLRTKSCPSSPSNRCACYLGATPKDTPSLGKVLNLWSSMKKETTLAFVSLDRASVDFFQYEKLQAGRIRTLTCQKKRQLEYWYYSDGSDDLIYRDAQINSHSNLDQDMCNVDELLVIGCWGGKDKGLLQFLNSEWTITKLHLIGLQRDVLDMILPQVTTMKNLESLEIRPFLNSSPYCDLTKTHFQILRTSSFSLKNLGMQLHTPSEAVIDFVQSQSFTLETVKLQSNINLSDRLTFSIPQLKILQLDEPPGCLLVSTLCRHSSLETINFGRSDCSYSQVKNKSPPRMDSLETEFEHNATEVLCDINWFLENATGRRTGVQRSILQQGSDSALKFFKHFPFLTSLTLRGVHAHYGILQGLFKKFTQLKKLALVNATGVNDEILTGFSKGFLEEMDIMNPFQITRERSTTKAKSKNTPSIRNLKCLTHLCLDDQPGCTDYSVIFGVLKLNQLEYFSCRKWKITDVSIRACADILPSLKEAVTEDCTNVSKQALEYFREKRARYRQAEE